MKYRNEKAFYLGVLAPDTIAGKKDATKEDKKRVHLREDIRDAQWLEVDNMELLYVKTEDIEDFIPFSVHWILDELEQLLR